MTAKRICLIPNGRMGTEASRMEMIRPFLTKVKASWAQGTL